jgi:hypothetical protein
MCRLEHPMRPGRLGNGDAAEDDADGLRDRLDARRTGVVVYGLHATMMPMSARMVFLGFGKYARADKIYALQPITGDNRGGGQRTLVWVEGVSDPIVASRTERTILQEMGQDAAAGTPLLDEALSLAERLAHDAEQGRVDLADLGRRARKLLESSAKPPEPHQLF